MVFFWVVCFVGAPPPPPHPPPTPVWGHGALWDASLPSFEVPLSPRVPPAQTPHHVYPYRHNTTPPDLCVPIPIPSPPYWQINFIQILCHFIGFWLVVWYILDAWHYVTFWWVPGAGVGVSGGGPPPFRPRVPPARPPTWALHACMCLHRHCASPLPLSRAMSCRCRAAGPRKSTTHEHMSTPAVPRQVHMGVLLPPPRPVRDRGPGANLCVQGHRVLSESVSARVHAAAPPNNRPQMCCCALPSCEPLLLPRCARTSAPASAIQRRLGQCSTSHCSNGR